MPAGQLGAGQERSIVAIKQCSVNTTSLEKAFRTGGDAIFCALTLSSLWHFSTVGADCSNCFLIFYQFSSVMQALVFSSPLQLPTAFLIIQVKTTPTYGNMQSHMRRRLSPQHYFKTFKSSHLQPTLNKPEHAYSPFRKRTHS